MAAAVIELSETNLVGAVVTDGITVLNLGGNDRPNIDYLTAGDKIIPGAFSYAKYVRVNFKTQASPTPVAVSGIRIWKSQGSYVTAQGIGSNALAVFAYAAKVMTYATPVNTVLAIGGTGFQVGDAQVNIATADPGSTNMGIGGALAGSLAAPGYSDYWVLQAYTGASSPTGSVNANTGIQTQFTYSWVET